MQKSKLFLGPLAMVIATSLVRSATLTGVPMQGGMIMPVLMYDAEHGHIHVIVMMDRPVPTLTPLLVSNPADSFDPGDPWFPALDSSGGGASFSRRYGFIWDSSLSDPLAPNTAVWIRKLSSTPGLNVYRYGDSAPKVLEPIFGTDGTTNARPWNLMMFHPCFTAAPGTNIHRATFEVLLVDTTTGLEVPGSSTGAFVFDFNNIPDGRPELSLAQKIVIAWPLTTPANWRLEAASAPNAAAWTVVTNAPVTLDGQPAVVLDGSAAQQYFRMRYAP